MPKKKKGRLWPPSAGLLPHIVGGRRRLGSARAVFFRDRNDKCFVIALLNEARDLRIRC